MPKIKFFPGNGRCWNFPMTKRRLAGNKTTKHSLIALQGVSGIPKDTTIYIKNDFQQIKNCSSAGRINRKSTEGEEKSQNL